MNKSLDEKLAQLRAEPAGSRFILADAKDADMAFGVSAGGPDLRPDTAHDYRSLEQYRDAMRAVVAEELVDIMLMSASTSERLTIQDRIFDGSRVTPAVRVNDSTDIWLAGGSGDYAAQPSLPFQTATLDHIQGGRLGCDPQQQTGGAQLGLYSLTFNNDAALDRASLAAYREFRLEAEAKGFRHFLEVFAPNAPGARAPADTGRFLVDHIARTLAGVTESGRPLFLKIPYLGPAAIELLVHYDPSLVVGILGGSAGTTHDAFAMLREAQVHGARAAIYGRKINHAEDQLAFLRQLRAVADGELSPEEAVRAYHGALQCANVRPLRSLEEDLQRTQ